MAYQTRCPECQAKLKFDDTPAADESIECPKCGNQFTTGASSREKSAAAEKPAKKIGGGKGTAVKAEKKKKPKGGKPAPGDAGPKKRKTKRKKSNRTILVLMAAGALTILTCIGVLAYILLGRVGKTEEMFSHVPADFNLIRGMNVSLISRYPGYVPELNPQFNNAVKDVAADLASAAGEPDAMAFVDYAVHAKKKQGGLAGEIFVIRTRNTIDGKAIGAKLGQEQTVDGTSCYRATGGAIRNAMVFSPNNRLLVVVMPSGSQAGILSASVGGPKAKENMLGGKIGDAGKKITSGHIWTMVLASGDLSNYISGMGELVKKDFAPLGTQLIKSKVYGTWVTFGVGVKVGVGTDGGDKETASSIATSLSEGPLGKGDDSEMPNGTKGVVQFAGTKEFKSEFLSNISYRSTGACVYAESKVNFEKTKQIITAFNNPFMGEGR